MYIEIKKNPKIKWIKFKKTYFVLKKYTGFIYNKKICLILKKKTC